MRQVEEGEIGLDDMRTIEEIVDDEGLKWVGLFLFFRYWVVGFSMILCIVSSLFCIFGRVFADFRIYVFS
jgi:hypothetical protein